MNISFCFYCLNSGLHPLVQKVEKGIQTIKAKRNIHSKTWFRDLTELNAIVEYTVDENGQVVSGIVEESYLSGIVIEKLNSLYQYEYEHKSGFFDSQVDGTAYFKFTAVEKTTWSIFGISITDTKNLSATIGINISNNKVNYFYTNRFWN